jgi:hypothetical protein
MLNTGGVNVLMSKKYCKVCGGLVVNIGDVDHLRVASDQEKYPLGKGEKIINYVQCGDCGFLFTEYFDEFDDKDWARKIYNEEYYNKVDVEYSEIRPSRQSRYLSLVLFPWKEMICIDYGAGNGMMAEKLRAKGYRFFSWDPFGMEVLKSSLPDNADFIAAFEVFEHHTNPIAMIKDMLSMSKNKNLVLFIVTSVLPKKYENNPLEWGYIGPRNGHISLATNSSMKKIASLLNLKYVGFNNVHIFQKRLYLRGYLIMISAIIVKIYIKFFSK